MLAQKICQRSKIISFLVRVQNSVFYPIFFAALCVYAGVNDHTVYLPIMWIMCACIAFSALCSPDNKVFLVPMLMAYYSLGNDTQSTEYVDTNPDYLQFFNDDAFKKICLCGIVMASIVIVRLIADGSVARAFKKRGLCTWGILALDAVFLLNGIFSDGYIPKNIAYGALLAVSLTVFYFLVLSMLDGSENAIPYACKALICTSYIALSQLLVLSARMYSEGELFHFSEAKNVFMINRYYINLSWGISTIIGAVIIIGIPAAMYLARTCRFPVISYTAALPLVLGAIFIDTRSAIITGVIFFTLSAIICCSGGRNKWTNRIYTSLLILGAVGALVYLCSTGTSLGELITSLKKVLRFDNLKSEARITLFKNGIEDFRASPIFGAGFSDGAYPAEEVKNNIYSMMYHNILAQILGAMGVVGAVGFFIHFKNVGELTVRRFSADRLLLIFVPLMTLFISLFDNFFFYPNFQIFYGVFLALAEISLEEARAKKISEHRRIPSDRKPRIAFTYVEAGKGHVVPEMAVQNAFEAKYGDCADIVTSSFYNETNDPKMKKTETLFIKTVKNQNKSFVAGALCRIGTVFCGDALSLAWVMSCTPSGIASCKRAKKHLCDLDCDILFTTHWSTAYYAAHIKDAPYCVLLCPDPYSNGMFNVEVNDFLITSEVGKKSAERKRAYAGGKITAVPPPIRPDARQYLGKRNELREKHGISQDSFTVVLLDGGYGMARLEKTIKHLLGSNEDITVIALCGTNHTLAERLNALSTPDNVKLIALEYCEDVLEYIALSDLFCGKAGANSLAEAAYFGVPIMITKCITYIEKHTRNYYTRKIKGAMYIPSAYFASKRISRFAKNRDLLSKYKKNISSLEGVSGEELVADILYGAIKKQMG